MSRPNPRVAPRLLTKAEAAEDELLSLRDAASLAFPDGRVGASGLRRERDRGRLTTYMVAGKEFTTLAAIKGMLTQCVVTPKALASGSERNGRTNAGPSPTGANGSSETVPIQEARAAALATVEELKRRFKDTSKPSMSQRDQSVSRTKSRSLM